MKSLKQISADWRAKNHQLAQRDAANRCRFCKRGFVPGQKTYTVVETQLKYCSEACYLDASGMGTTP